jgi:hypothetical protein
VPNIIVIGTSAGGLEPLKMIVRTLPADLQARGFHRNAPVPFNAVDSAETVFQNF